MYATNAWHAEGLRWIATLLTDAAASLERRADTPDELVPYCPSRACDEARARLERYY